QWQVFMEQGYIRLGKVVTDDELRTLQQRIDDIMMGTAPIPYDRIMMQLDTTTGLYKDMDPQTKGHKGATLTYRKMQDLEWDPVFLRYMQKPLFRHLCGRAYGEEAPGSCFRTMFMNKPAHRGTVLPWHQDVFSDLDRDPEITVWMAMDAATVENGCVCVLPGSHLRYANDGRIAFLTEAQVETLIHEIEPVYLECPAGEALLLHNRLVHSSGLNPTGCPRRAFSVCYIDGRTTSSQGAMFSRIFGEEALIPTE
ncbi:MAG: phytanoyl-CoA dioxygenase family protein, partial [candidate division Zixibacteria bacterium]|nr:phytanoyl-CoA dioxygenase family protein [candidate division Zixibacteria bacterium]